VTELTDAQKIERLWDRLDIAASKADSQNMEIDTLRDKVRKLEDALAEAQSTIRSMATEINSARAAAANAVQEFIAASKE
jgi:predicted  nucleic acid-binding Zn-ribbon protein